MKHTKPEPKKVNVALQGGGAHGALAWGILDALLDDERIEIEAITATSAGTMNALAYAQGMVEGGREGAKTKLAHFWEETSKAGTVFSPVHGNPMERFFGLGSGENPYAYFMFDTMTRLFSPYQLNPMDINPLRDIIERTIDFEKIHKCGHVKLFISATNVKTGHVKVFRTPELTMDIAMASACLPFLFKAVEVNGESYWDGGYTANPALYPVFYETKSADLILIHLNPIIRDEVPTTAPAILNRINEVSFNSSLLQELRAVAFVKKLIENDMIKEEYKHLYKNMLIHPLRADDMMKEYSITSKFDTDWDFLTSLHGIGYAGMVLWLKKNFDNIGNRSSVNLYDEYLTDKSEVKYYFEKDTMKVKKKKVS